MLNEREQDGVKTRGFRIDERAGRIEKMIAGTGLIFNRDEETNAFAVSFPSEE